LRSGLKARPEIGFVAASRLAVAPEVIGFPKAASRLAATINSRAAAAGSSSARTSVMNIAFHPVILRTPIGKNSVRIGSDASCSGNVPATS
jgi:hypothetical protein